MPFTDEPVFSDDSIDIDLVLSKLNSCCNDPNFDISTFSAIHGMDSDDVPLTREDVISHFLNGQCASRKAPGCSEVAHSVRSPIRIALMTTEAIVVRYECKQISPNDLQTYCSAIGVTTTRRPEHTILMQKLRTRCGTLRPLLDCDGLETVLSGVGSLGKRTLEHLSSQHNLNANPEVDADSMKTTIVDHVTSGQCQASSSSLCTSINNEYCDGASGASATSDLETYILQLAAEKKKLSKKALRRVLKSRNIEFDDSENVGKLRQHLRLHITSLRKGKQSEWSRNQRGELESEHDHRLDEIREV